MSTSLTIIKDTVEHGHGEGFVGNYKVVSVTCVVPVMNKCACDVVK